MQQIFCTQSPNHISRFPFSGYFPGPRLPNFNCNNSPCDFTSRGPLGSPDTWPTYRTQAQISVATPSRLLPNTPPHESCILFPLPNMSQNNGFGGNLDAQIAILQRRKKRTQPPPKEIFLENFSGLKEKLSRPVVDTKTPKNRENHIHHRNLSSVDHIFSAKKSSALEQGGVCFLFPSIAIAPILNHNKMMRFEIAECSAKSQPNRLSIC